MDSQDSAPSEIKRRNSRVIFALIVMVIALGFAGIFKLEPTDAPEYVNVVVDSYHSGGRGSHYFIVESLTTHETWNVGAGNSQVASDYIGPAVLTICKGRWTGINHYRLEYSKEPGSP